MFDDHITPKPQSGSISGQVPPNLPFVEPEDMLAPVESDNGNLEPVADLPTENTVTAAPSALGAGVLKPANKNLSATAEPTVAIPKPRIPPELQGTIPVSESPEDMFADEENNSEEPLVTPMAYQPPAVNESVAPAPLTMDPPPVPIDLEKPPMAAPPPMGGSVSQMPPPLPQDESYSIKEPSLSRGIMASIIIAVVVLILGGGGWWIYHAVVSDNNSNNNELGQPNTPTTPVEDIQAPQVPTSNNDNLPPLNVDDAVLFGLPVDSDGDGLSDYDEINYWFTDPNNWDSDNDGLSDGDEVLIWKTDPNNPDTDGDGYLDGEEVRAGYNPLGPGRIFEAPSLNNTNEEVVAPPVIGGEQLPSFATGTVESTIDLSLFESISGTCTEEQINRMVLASIDVLTAQGYTITPAVVEDQIVFPLLFEEVKKRSTICEIAKSTEQ